MNSSLLAEAVDLVDEAAHLEPPTREAFYTGRCRNRADLLALVRRIEAAPSDSRAPVLGDSLEELAPLLFPPDEPAIDLLLGTRIGPYRVDARIGAGGMGLVYRAEHTGHHDQVALKVLQGPVAATAQGRNRLQREVELLARCKHPAIVRALYSDTLPDGRTYFTMDLVEGRPITDYCQSANLPLPERLALFLAVCDAVQAAHNVGVFHRDLKPSNILVSTPAFNHDHPSVRLLDFGIAEAFGEGDPAIRSYIAVAYAAPEHAQSTTAQTDVYSLGILLAELVLGRLPFNISDRNPSALRRSILQQGLQPLHRLARQAKPGHLSRLSRLRWRELEAISGRAAAPDPKHRYATVRELAADVDRFTHRRPVLALALPRSRHALYQALRLAARNRAGVAAALAACLLIAGLVASYTWGLRQSRNAALNSRNAALEAAAHAEKMQQLAAGLFLDGSGPVNASLTAEDLVNRAMENVGTLDSEPEEQGDFLLTIGQSYQGLGRYPKAEAALAQSLAIRTRLHGHESPQAAEVISQQADLRSAQGKPGEGLVLAQRALAIQQRTLPPGDKAILESQTIIAELWTDLGDYQKPVPLLEDVIRQETGKPTLLGDLSTALNNLSIVENYLGHTQRSMDLQEQTIAIDRKLEGPRHADIGMHLITLSTGHSLLGKYTLAEAEAREALSILKEKLPSGHHDIAAAESHLGVALMHQARWPEAQACLEESLRVFTAEPVRSRSEATALWALGATYEGEGKLSQALNTFRLDLAEYQHLYPAPHSLWTSPLRGIASVLLQQGNPREAEHSAHQAYDICRSQLAASDPRTLQSEVLLGRALTAQHHYDQAEPLLQEAARLAAAGGQATAELRPKAAQALLGVEAAIAGSAAQSAR